MEEQPKSDQQAEVRAFVEAYLRERLTLLGASEMALPDDLNMIDTGVIDSMGFIEMLGETEDRFGVEVDLEDHAPELFATVGGFIDCVSQARDRSAA